MNKDTLYWLESVTGEKITPQTLICRGCDLYIHRHKGDVNCTRWKKINKEVERCEVDECVNEASRVSSSENVELVLGRLKTDVDNRSEVKLCNSHYQELYKALNLRKCASCHSKPKPGQNYNRKCPDPSYITAFMQANEGFESSISINDKICMDCYLKHKQILSMKGVQQVQESDVIFNCIKKTNDEFVQLALVDDKEYFQFIANIATSRLMDTLSNDNAMLLPDLYQQFEELAHEHQNKLNSPSVLNDLPSHRWLLTYVQNRLGSYLSVATKHKKYGVLLYRKDGD
jgi:hypothetical protein